MSKNQDDFEKLIGQLADLPAETRDAVLKGVEASVQEKIKKAAKASFPKTVTLYAHRNKEDNYYEGEKLGLTGLALDNFRYVGYEVEFNCVVALDGTVHATHVNSVPLVTPVKL